VIRKALVGGGEKSERNEFGIQGNVKCQETGRETSKSKHGKGNEKRNRTGVAVWGKHKELKERLSRGGKSNGTNTCTGKDMEEVKTRAYSSKKAETGG